MSWKVTVRHGPDVNRERFDSVEEALEDTRGRIESILREGRLDKAEGFRTYGPEELVHARIEISGPGLVRGPEAGIDVMGDGTLVPYRGAIRKQRLEADSLEGALGRLREALA